MGKNSDVMTEREKCLDCLFYDFPTEDSTFLSCQLGLAPVVRQVKKQDDAGKDILLPFVFCNLYCDADEESPARHFITYKKKRFEKDHPKKEDK